MRAVLLAAALCAASPAYGQSALGWAVQGPWRARDWLAASSLLVPYTTRDIIHG